jgi:hypothetical protein
MLISPRRNKSKKPHERSRNGERHAHVKEDAMELKEKIYMKKKEKKRREFRE